MTEELFANILAPLALMLASPFFFVSAIKQRRRRIFFHSQGILAEGVVIRVDEEKGIDDFTNNVPKIGYMAIGQQWITVSYGGSKLKTGDIVAILYNPRDYKDFVAANDGEVWIELMFGVVGMIMLMIGLIWILNIIRR